MTCRILLKQLKKRLNNQLIEDTVVSDTGDKIRRTPAARKLAEENQISLSEITGSGPLGRIQKNDVEIYLELHAKRITPLGEKIANDQGIDYKNIAGSGSHEGKCSERYCFVTNLLQEDERITSSQDDKRVPFKGIRKVIAE